jgi:hypothetical protein
MLEHGIVLGPGALHPYSLKGTVEGTMPVEEQRARAALAEAGLTGVALLEVITARVSELQIDDQRMFIAKMVTLLSPSVLGMAPTRAAAPPRPAKFKRKLFGSVRGSRQSARLKKVRCSFSYSRSSQVVVCKKLGLIDNVEDFTDDTLLAYVNLFKEPIMPTNIAKLAALAGLSSPAQIHLPNAELQALHDELPARSS